MGRVRVGCVRMGRVGVGGVRMRGVRMRAIDGAVPGGGKALDGVRADALSDVACAACAKIAAGIGARVHGAVVSVLAARVATRGLRPVPSARGSDFSIRAPAARCCGGVAAAVVVVSTIFQAVGVDLAAIAVTSGLVVGGHGEDQQEAGAEAVQRSHIYTCVKRSQPLQKSGFRLQEVPHGPHGRTTRSTVRKEKGGGGSRAQLVPAGHMNE